MSKEVRVGSLIAIGAAILIVAVFLVGDQEGIWKSKYKLKIQYNDVYGLLTGAPVRLAGLRVGSVTDITFSKTAPGMLDVTVSIDETVKERIRADSKAIIGTLGLLGDKTIEISTGSPEYLPLEENDYIQPGKSASIEALIARGSETVDNIAEISHQTKEIVEKINNGTGTLGLFVNDPDIYFDLDRLLILTENLTRHIESGEGSLAKLVRDPVFYEELTRFLSSANNTIDSLTTGSGTLGRLLNNPEPFEDLSGILANWKQITDGVSAGEGTAGQLLTDDSLYINLTRTLDRTEALLKDFRENPGRYVKFSIF